MDSTFWASVDSYTRARSLLAPVSLAGLGLTVLLLLIGLRLLPRRGRVSVVCAALGLGGAVALFLPGLLLARADPASFGFDPQTLFGLPSSATRAVAGLLDSALLMCWAGVVALVVGGVGLSGALGSREIAYCPICKTELHPSWEGHCPEPHPQSWQQPAEALRQAEPRGEQPGFEKTRWLLPGDPGASAVEQRREAWIETLGPLGQVEHTSALSTRLVIGRDPGQSDLLVDDSAVSGCHAVIEPDRQGWVVYDWNSTNGTRVNDELIKKHALRDGDEIQVGQTRLRFSDRPGRHDNVVTVEWVDQELPAARLVVLDGSRAGRAHPIRKVDTRIGRDHRNDLVLDSPSVSREHASVQFNGVDYDLVDPGTSKNGILLDEQRVFNRTRLRSGQIIRLADQQIRFELQETAGALEE